MAWTERGLMKWLFVVGVLVMVGAMVGCERPSVGGGPTPAHTNSLPASPPAPSVHSQLCDEFANESTAVTSGLSSAGTAVRSDASQLDQAAGAMKVLEGHAAGDPILAAHYEALINALTSGASALQQAYQQGIDIIVAGGSLSAADAATSTAVQKVVDDVRAAAEWRC